jgi:hypothetical protein
MWTWSQWRARRGGKAVAACAAVAVAAGLAVALAACGASGGTTAAGGSGTSALQQERAVLHQYANCVRSHGYPNFPDPQANAQGISLVGGTPQDKQAATQTKGACAGLLNRLPAASGGQQPPLTATQLRQARLFAACMRSHGLPVWPDPRPDGSYSLAGTPYQAMGKSGPVLAGLQACRQYETFGGIRES